MKSFMSDQDREKADSSLGSAARSHDPVMFLSVNGSDT